MIVTFYKNCMIQPNHCIQDVMSYLSKLSTKETFTLTDSKAFKSDLDSFSVRVDLSDKSTDILANYKDFNYCTIGDSTHTQMYFVTGWTNISQYIYDANVSLDVVNTYNKDAMDRDLFKQVSVKRCHKDRFNSMGVRKFDEVDEGFEPDVKTTTSVAVGDNNRSYIVYKQDTTTTSGYVKSPADQFRKLWYPETSQSITIDQYKLDTTWTLKNLGGVSTLVVDDSTQVNLSTFKPRLLLLSPSGLAVRINKPNYNQFSIFCNAILITIPSWHNDENDFKITTYYFNYDNGYLTYLSGDTYDYAFSYHLQIYGLQDWTAAVDYYNTSSYPSLTADKKYVVSELCQESSLSTITASTVTPTATSLSMVNKSNSELKQITEIPFIPGPASLCYLGGDNNEIAVKSNTDLLFKSGQEVTISEWQPVTIPTDRLITRQKIYETKLYGSYCRNYYLNYDNNTLVLQPERWENTTPKVTSYAPCDYSNNLGFKVLGFTNRTEYDNWLLCARNNNVQISTGDYLEYIRTGYNYDVKAKNLQSIKNWTSFGLGVASTAATVGLGIGMKAASNTLTNVYAWQQVINSGSSVFDSLNSNIMAEIQNQQALDQKKVQAMNSTINISGNDNLALFHQYNQSTGLRFNKTKPHDYVEDSMFNLFYYFGYADNRTYEVMPIIKTRQYFNYVQADINHCTITNPKERQRLINAFSDGITFEWHYNDTWLMEGNLYENWETQL